MKGGTFISTPGLLIDSTMSTASSHNIRWLKITGIVVGSVILLIIGLLIFVSLWFTPKRLSAIVNDYASEYLQADVDLQNLDFSVWSSFPRFILSADSCIVYSRALDNLDQDIKDSLPSNYRRLFASGKFRGSLNIPALLANRIKFHDVELSDMALNLVAVSDTVANWLIFPRDNNSRMKIPQFEANLISFPSPQYISYNSLQTGLSVLLEPKTMMVESIRKHNNNYHCKFTGLISLSMPDMNLLSGFPFDLQGNFRLDFNPIKIAFSNFGIGLGNIKGSASLDLLADTDTRVNSFSCNFDSFRLFKFLEYLPAAMLPDLKTLPQTVDLKLSARLSQPYSFSSGHLPSVEVNVELPEGKIDYLLGNRPLTINHSTLAASLDFNGENVESSTLSLAPFNVEAAGLKILCNTSVDSLMMHPKVNSIFRFEGDLKKIASLFNKVSELKPSGEVNGELKLDFSLPAFNVPAPQNISLQGNIEAHSFAMYTEAEGTSKVEGDSLKINFLSKGEMTDGNLTTTGKSDIALTAKSASWSRGKTLLGCRNLSIKGVVDLLKDFSGFKFAEAQVSSSSFSIATPGHFLSFNGIDIETSLRRASRTEKNAVLACRMPSFKDSLWLKRTPHLPDVLRVNSPGFAKFVKNWRLPVNLRLNSASWSIKGYPYPFRLHDTDLSCDFDSLVLRRFELSSGTSDMKITGILFGFRNLIAGAPFAPVHADLTLKGGCIDINQIAKATHGDKKSSALKRTDSPHKTDSNDITPAWIIPRNIIADLHLSAYHTLYTNLDLSNLNSHILVKDGKLNIPELSLSAGFGNLGLSALYDSSNLADLSMKAAVDLTDLKLQPMYGKLKSMVEDFPQIKNLSGEAGLKASVGFNIFPDMSVDMGSLSADMIVTGRGLVLRQDPFVRRITKMLLVRHDNPISIKDIDIRATVHDNLLELYPFWLDFENYKLSLSGVNNFAGDLDYHVGVFHSPIPIHFGINVEGTYHHPHIRLGGSSWKPEEAMRITSDIEKSFTWNFVNKMKWAGNELMKKAASGQTL